MLGRRKFLGTLTAGVAASAVPAGVISASALPTLHAQFAGSLDSQFVLKDSSGATAKARLIAVDDGPECRGLEQFSVVFEGDDLNEGWYEVYHPNTGTLQVGLVASGGTASKRQRAYLSKFV